MKNRKIRWGGALVLATALLIGGLKLPGAYGASAVDTKKACQIEFTLGKNAYGDGTAETDQQEMAQELKALRLQINLYRVAEITETGAYKTAEPYQNLGIEEADSSTTAADWADMAKKAAEKADSSTLAGSVVKDGAAEGTEGADRAKIEDLKPGMYLVTVEDARSECYTYQFSPSLISLPSQYYEATGSDAWVYELTGEYAVGLKPERQERTGDLEIVKTLSSYHAAVGGADFVFEVSVVKPGEATAETNVYQLSFSKPGTQILRITDLPAGAEVTVKEIYAGASYSLSSEPEKTVVIRAENPEGESQEEGYPASVTFTNAYDGRRNGGTGVVNTFYEEDGTVKWKNDAKGE